MFLNKSNKKDIQNFNILYENIGTVFGREIDVSDYLYGILYLCDDFQSFTYNLDNCGIFQNDADESLLSNVKKLSGYENLKMYRIKTRMEIIEEI